jgi:hypothetical protein
MSKRELVSVDLDAAMRLAREELEAAHAEARNHAA